MLTPPWRSFGTGQEGSEYLVLLLYLPLKRLRALPRFLWYALLIMGQLRRSEGLMGYSLGTRLSTLEFWSLSVWMDEESLKEFVLKAPHSRVMRAMTSHVGRTESVRWSTDGAYVPPNWREAKERMRGR